jgi:hypothetical protein
MPLFPTHSRLEPAGGPVDGRVQWLDSDGRRPELLEFLAEALRRARHAAEAADGAIQAAVVTLSDASRRHPAATARFGEMAKSTPPRRGRPLAWHLGVLCAALLLPMCALEAFLLVQMANGERARHQAEARDAARRVAVSLDRGLTTMQAMQEVLATNEHLRANNFEAFRRRALEVLRSTGTEITVRDRQGRTLVDTGPWPPRDGSPDPDTERAALESGRPQVTDLLAGEEGRPRRFAIVAPGAGPGGERDYVVELSVPVKALDDVLGRGEIPAGMTASVLDRRGTILTRSAEPERFVGRSLSPDAPARTETRPEGWRRTVDATGSMVVLAWSRSEVAGWTTAVFPPESAFEAPLRRSLWSAAALGAVLAALAAALAFVFARRIARPIAAHRGPSRPWPASRRATAPARPPRGRWRRRCAR